MSRSRLLGAILFAAVVLAALWASLSSSRPRASHAPTSPEPPPTVAIAPPPTPRPPPRVTPPKAVPLVTAPKEVTAADDRHDPHCGPGQSWVDESASHADPGAATGCFAIDADGGIIREGTWTLRGVDNLLHRGSYVHGREEGEWVARYESGRKAEEVNYEGGVLDGWQTIWDEDGVQIAQRHYRNGALDGTVTMTDPNGQVTKEEWRNGMRIDPPLP